MQHKQNEHQLIPEHSDKLLKTTIATQIIEVLNTNDKGKI